MCWAQHAENSDNLLILGKRLAADFKVNRMMTHSWGEVGQIKKYCKSLLLGLFHFCRNPACGPCCAGGAFLSLA